MCRNKLFRLIIIFTLKIVFIKMKFTWNVYVCVRIYNKIEKILLYVVEE